MRRGERVRRGQRLGTVGATGWAMSPGLHYEYWSEAEAARPDRSPIRDFRSRLGRRDVSLEKMRATSATGAMEPLPGLR